MNLFNTIKRSFMLSLNYSEQDSKWDYFVLLVFQILWFAIYFFWLSGDSLSFLLLIVFILPIVSASLRCLNYLNRTKAIGFLWLISPYLMVILPLLLTKKHQE
ncbi:hypothetical protein HQN64_00240 [Enterobacteriaceae bacterium BIT-l23]|uniref:hypothetical protein n=1 Tax=Jejubacter sp. L23 TaxID=3092086 RepID=UPI00158453B7|nr:hypothetical protein [Enterobacteriaceae bacterium BIT-l23]